MSSNKPVAHLCSANKLSSRALNRTILLKLRGKPSAYNQAEDMSAHGDEPLSKMHEHLPQRRRGKPVHPALALLLVPLDYYSTRHWSGNPENSIRMRAKTSPPRFCIFTEMPAAVDTPAPIPTSMFSACQMAPAIVSKCLSASGDSASN